MAAPTIAPAKPAITSKGVPIELTSIDVLIAGLATMHKYLTDVVPTTAEHAEVSSLLHGAPRRFKPDNETMAALHRLAEIAPDHKDLTAWYEQLGLALTAAKAFKAKGAPLAGSGAAGDLEAAVGE